MFIHKLIIEWYFMTSDSVNHRGCEYSGYNKQDLSFVFSCLKCKGLTVQLSDCITVSAPLLWQSEYLYECVQRERESQMRVPC